MKSRLFQLIFFTLLFNAPLFAQFNESIVSDRPGQSNSPYTVGKMIFQLQTGLQFGGSSMNDDKTKDFELPAFLRFGITENIELNTLWSFKNIRSETLIRETTSSGLNVVGFGIRFNIFEETEKAPALGFEFGYKTKLVSDDFKPENPATKFMFMASKGLSDLISITANLGADFDGNTGQSDGLYTLNLVLAVNDNLSVFFENYGFFNSDKFDTYFDFGGAYILNSNLQLDLYGGFGYNNDTFSYLVSGGVSYRIIKWGKNE